VSWDWLEAEMLRGVARDRELRRLRNLLEAEREERLFGFQFGGAAIVGQSFARRQVPAAPLPSEGARGSAVRTFGTSPLGFDLLSASQVVCPGLLHQPEHADVEPDEADQEYQTRKQCEEDSSFQALPSKRHQSGSAEALLSPRDGLPHLGSADGRQEHRPESGDRIHGGFFSVGAAGPQSCLRLDKPVDHGFVHAPILSPPLPGTAPEGTRNAS
jgi:hypothetical protein